MWSKVKETVNAKKIAMTAVLTVGVAVCFYAVVAIGTHVYIVQVLLPRIHRAAAELERLEPRIVVDLKQLDEKPVFTQLPRAKNAEHFLSGFISWTGEDLELHTPEHDRLMDLMAAYEYAPAKDETWTRFVRDPDVASYDLSWVDQLTAYDHIDFATHRTQVARLEQIEGANSMDRIGLAATLPVPELRELRFATVARVAQLQREHRLAEAPPLVRHIAYLFSTTDSLIGSMMAASMLSAEKALQARTRIDWPLISDDRIEAYRRVSWAWTGIERLRASRDTLGAFQPYFNRATSACTGSFEAVAIASELADYFAPTAPFEFDLRDKIARVQAFQGRLLDLCDRENLKVFLAPVQDDANPLFISRYQPNVARIPFLRRIVGLHYLAVAVPNYFMLYDRSPREPASK